MSRLLHASYSGYFPFCISSGTIPAQSKNTITGEIDLQDAMDIYWNIESLLFSISINVSWTFKFYPYYPDLSGPVICRQSIIYGTSFVFEDRLLPINNNPTNLVCYSPSYLQYFGPPKEIGQNIFQALDPPEDPVFEPAIAFPSASFVGFPNNLFETIKKTANNKYGCGLAFNIVGGYDISTEPTAQYNFPAGKFSGPYFGERDIFVQAGYSEAFQDVNFEESSGDGISIEINSTRSWS